MPALRWAVVVVVGVVVNMMIDMVVNVMGGTMVMMVI